MDLLKEKTMQCWNPKVEKIKVWQMWSDSRLKWFKCVLNLILSIGMPYYQEGCNIDYLTRSKVLIDDPCEDPERKPLWTNLETLEWSRHDLMDQVEACKQDLGFSGLDRSYRSGGPVWPVRAQRLVGLNWPVGRTGLTGLHWQKQRLVFGSGVFIPLSPLLWGLLVLGFHLSFLRLLLDQLALPNTLCELC